MQEPKEVIGGHVPTSLAAEIRAMAERGNRSVSREVYAALRAHIEVETARALPIRQRAESPERRPPAEGVDRVGDGEAA